MTLGANTCGVLLLEFYTMIGGAREELALLKRLSAHRVALVVGAGLPLLVIGLGVVLSRWISKPMWIWYLAAEPASPPPAKIQRLALGLPFRIARFTFAIWLLIGVLEALILWPFWGDILFVNEAYQYHATLSLALVCLVGPITAILIYFAVERVWEAELPFFLCEMLPRDISMHSMTFRQRLLYIFALSILPMVFMAVEAHNQARQVADSPTPRLLRELLYKEVYLVGLWILVMGVLAVTLGRSMVEAVETLRRKMTAVCEGDLESHVPVVSNDEFGDLAAGFNAMVDGLRQERVIRGLFGRYVSPQVAEHAIEHGAMPGGQTVEATVLFADIRGFTSLAEQMPADALIALLNRYFTTMATVVTEHGGLVNKFGGDSLLAIFGMPLNPLDDHPARAVQAAVGMYFALQAFNDDQRRRDEPPLHIGIGIATGTVVAGNVGSEERLEYTVIGDTVNLASRLESMTKSVNAVVLLSEQTARAVQAWATLRYIDEVDIKGKCDPVPVFSLGDLHRGEPKKAHRLVVSEI
jgi:class 3 adenylate cyclase